MSMITNAVQSMSLQELNALRDLIAQEETRRRTEITEAYGENFCNIVGIDNIFALKKVEAQDLNIHHNEDYPHDCAKPSMMKENSAVRGIMGKRPFIGIKVEIVDPQSKKIIGVVVEVVFKRYTRDENNYVTALSNATDDGKSIQSCLYCNAGMIDSQITAVRDLLEGRQIEALCGPKYLVRMVK